MKFTIKTLTVESASVEFDNGSTANVPLNKGLTKEQIIERVSNFNHVLEYEDNVSALPVKEGDELEVSAPDSDPELNYDEARSRNYPKIGNQLDALYWDREGDDTQKKIIDAKIKLIKEKIPKGKTYKTSELDSLLD